MSSSLLACFSHPCTTDSLDAVSLINLSTVSRAIHLTCQTQAYYRSLCFSYCQRAGIYSLRLRIPSPINYKDYFYSELLRLRTKFDAIATDDDSTDGCEHKIHVACRFRPGCLDNSKLALPLHQFLRVKRQQRQKTDQPPTEFILGKDDPPEFMDPLLGVVMHEPVLLQPSQRVVDRSIAVQCVLRGGRDPFNNQRLSMDMLIPQEELSSRIRAWREENKGRPDVAVDREEVGFLVDELNKSVNLIDVLRDVEKMNAILRKTREAAFSHVPQPDEDDEDSEEGGDREEAGRVAQQQEMPLSVSDLAALNPRAARPRRREGETTPSTESRKKDVAKVISVSPLQSTVTMNVPGRGVYPFYFSAVFEQQARQRTIFESAAADAVTAALNGENACLLCYGQVSWRLLW